MSFQPSNLSIIVIVLTICCAFASGITCNSSSHNEDGTKGFTASSEIMQNDTDAMSDGEGELSTELYENLPDLEYRLDFEKMSASDKNLCMTLCKKSGEEAVTALHSLIRFPNANLIPILNELCKTDSSKWENGELIFSLCIEQLGEFGNRTSLEILLRMLAKHPNGYLKSKAAQALGRLGYQDSVLPLMDACSHKNLMVRWRAAEALGLLKDKRAAGSLLALLEDKDYNVRRAAVESIGLLGWKEGSDTMLHLLHNDSEISVRTAAIKSLVQIDPVRALDTLPNMLIQDKDAEIQIAAANALGLIQAAESLEALKQGYIQNNQAVVRDACVQGLARFDKDKTGAFLQRIYFVEDNQQVKQSIRWALDLFGLPVEQPPEDDIQLQIENQPENQETQELGETTDQTGNADSQLQKNQESTYSVDENKASSSNQENSISENTTHTDNKRENRTQNGQASNNNLENNSENISENNSENISENNSVNNPETDTTLSPGDSELQENETGDTNIDSTSTPTTHQSENNADSSNQNAN